uniref:AAA family ATPase n=1 Tax=Frigidibacter oleivorans TaxID=2487129 RepID=UPI0013DFBFA0
AGLRGRLGLGRRGRPEGDSGGADPAPPGPLSVLAFQGTCGGAGATTLAVTLAAELARLGLETCLLDLDPQFGGVATYLDLRAPSQVADAYRNLTRLDTDAFRSCLVEAAPGLKVFPAPDEVLPLDAIDEESVSRLIGCARAVARVVVIDMPHALADWSDRAYVEADRVYCVSLPDVRSAQNARKLMALLSGARLPPGRMVHCLNRLPQRRLPPELQRNIASFEQGLGRPFAERFVDGGVEVSAACDLGTPLAELAAANPLRRQVAALADRLAADHRTAAEARGAGLLAPQGSRA